MKVSTRNILKDRSNLKMSSNVTEFDTKMVDSKCSMTLRKKASVKENQSIGTNSEKVGSLKKSKKENANSKESSNNIEKGVLTENNKTLMLLSLPEVNNFVKSVKKANSKDSDMAKQTPILKRPRRGIKTHKDSSEENLGIVPPKPRKRKHNEENSGTVLNVNKNKKSKGTDEEQISGHKFEQEIKNLSKSLKDPNLKGSDENLCCHKSNTPIENLESINDVDSYLLKKPGTRSTKKEVAKKKLKGVDKSVDLDAYIFNSLLKAESVRIQTKKKNETSSESKSTNYKIVDQQTEAGFAKDVKFLKQKYTSKKTLKRNKNTNIKCNSESKITNYFNTEMLSEKKASSLKTPSVTIQRSGHIPIYKKVNESAEPKRIKKHSRVSDVYNIEFDEDIKNSPPHLKKKKPKKATKSKCSKSKAVKVLKKNKAATTSSAKTVKNITAQIQYNSTSSPHQDTEDIMDVDPILSDSTQMAEEPPMHSQDSNKNIQEKTSSDKGIVVLEEEKLNNPVSETPEKQSNLQRISKIHAHFVLASSSPVPSEREPANLSSETPDQESNKNNGEMNLMTFLSDFEASIPRPQMTSTPDNTDRTLPAKKPVISKKHPAVRKFKICSIPAIKNVQDPNFVSDVEFESPEKIDLSEITLFESPTKAEGDKSKETSHQKKAGKKCQTKLNFEKSNKTVQKNESEKISSSLLSTHSDPETAQSSGENSHPKSPQRVLREKNIVVPQEIELSEDESDFEDDLFCLESDNEDENEKENGSNNPSKSPVKFLEVLKPRKSYSPSVKPCFSRTKKATLPEKQYVSEEEKLIQSMNEHFSELDSLELCIE